MGEQSKDRGSDPSKATEGDLEGWQDVLGTAM